MYAYQIMAFNFTNPRYYNRFWFYLPRENITLVLNIHILQILSLFSRIREMSNKSCVKIAPFIGQEKCTMVSYI
jgi:hypothetical protein